jgi:hypothetical protein
LCSYIEKEIEPIFQNRLKRLKYAHIRPYPAVGVKIATQKVQISTLTTGYLKNTPTIISIPLFIFLKY